MVGALDGALEGALATPGEQLSEESEAERSNDSLAKFWANNTGKMWSDNGNKSFALQLWESVGSQAAHACQRGLIELGSSHVCELLCASEAAYALHIPLKAAKHSFKEFVHSFKFQGVV